MTTCSARRVLSAVLLSAASSAPALAQVTVRDTIVALPPISICQDGATHRTVCTNLRLRPGTVGNLAPFVGMPLELTGTPGAVTCSFVTLSGLTVLPSAQTSSATVAAGTMTVQFFGNAPAGDVYLMFLGLTLGSTSTVPGVAGTVHLDPLNAVFVGLFVPVGPATPIHTISLPTNPLLLGVDFYDQSIALHSSGAGETTNVDCFQF